LDGMGQSNSTATILYGANLMTGQSEGSWTLHNLLRTIEDMYGLPHSDALRSCHRSLECLPANCR
jgi:hypothetical protein